VCPKIRVAGLYSASTNFLTAHQSWSSVLARKETHKSQRPQDGQHPQVSLIFAFVVSVTDGDVFLELAEPVRLLLVL